MEFSKFVWKLYVESQDGKNALEADIEAFVSKNSQDGKPFSAFLECWEIKNEEVLQDGEFSREEVNLREFIRVGLEDDIVENDEQAHKLFIDTIDEGFSTNFEDEGQPDKEFAVSFGGGLERPDQYQEMCSDIEGFSAGLHDLFPEYFFPYMFVCRFNEFQRICNAFNIQIPEVPSKKNKRERILYYLEINTTLQSFRKKHELSPKDFNAFFYDFAPKNIQHQTHTDMPSPSRIWFIIGGVGGNGDFKHLDEATDETKFYWQGNLETRRGDIILMWCASPRSYIHSIWRATDSGYNDPFFYFYSMVRLGNPVKVTPLKFSSINGDPILSKKPQVKGKFQGASGSTFSVEEYKILCGLLKEQGQDIKKLPEPPKQEEFEHIGLNNERDVELKLLEPLLLKLGFEEKDWIRQFSVRMGRGERNYPDYVLGGNPKHGEESAVALVECKYEINKNAEMKDAFLQAKSYALRLQAKVLMLVATRGIWVFNQRSDGFSVDHFIFKSWQELAHPDHLHEISLLFGKRVIEGYKTQKSKAS